MRPIGTQNLLVTWTIRLIQYEGLAIGLQLWPPKQCHQREDVEGFPYDVRWCSLFFQLSMLYAWLVVWNIFPLYIGNNHRNWLTLFRGLKPPTRCCLTCCDKLTFLEATKTVELTRGVERSCWCLLAKNMVQKIAKNHAATILRIVGIHVCIKGCWYSQFVCMLFWCHFCILFFTRGSTIGHDPSLQYLEINVASWGSCTSHDVDIDLDEDNWYVTLMICIIRFWVIMYQLGICICVDANCPVFPPVQRSWPGIITAAPVRIGCGRLCSLGVAGYNTSFMRFFYNNLLALPFMRSIWHILVQACFSENMCKRKYRCSFFFTHVFNIIYNLQ